MSRSAASSLVSDCSLVMDRPLVSASVEARAVALNLARAAALERLAPFEAGTLLPGTKVI